MVNVLLYGCNGKMGQVITELAKEDGQAVIAAGIDAFRGVENRYPVFEKLEDCETAADVLIDFSNADALEGILSYCVKKQMPAVLCSTGYSEEQLRKIEEASKETAILRSANMSLGINLLLKLVKEAARILGPAGFDVELVEKHHNQKLDAPSGTALALADAVREALGGEAEYVCDRSKARRKRDPKEIGISAVRGGTIVGEHELLFAGRDEVITFSHTAYSKSIFGKGALEAAKFLAGKPAGMYDMSDVIQF